MDLDNFLGLLLRTQPGLNDKLPNLDAVAHTVDEMDDEYFGETELTAPGLDPSRG